MPEWPLDKEPASSAARRKPNVRAQKQRSGLRVVDNRESGDDKTVSDTLLDALAESMQHSDHHGLLFWQDPITRQSVPGTIKNENIDFDPYDRTIFPKMNIATSTQRYATEKGFAQRVACSASDALAGVSLYLDGDYMSYKGTVFTDSAEQKKYIDEPKSRILTLGSSLTWLTLKYGQRRVIQQLTGAALLINQGAEVGEPNLPPVGTRERVLADEDWQLYGYPDAVAAEKMPFLRVVHRDRSITSFLGFLAHDLDEARQTIGADPDNELFVNSALDMSIVSRRDPAAETLLGDTIARTMLLPDILPPAMPIDEQLA